MSYYSPDKTPLFNPEEQSQPNYDEISYHQAEAGRKAFLFFYVVVVLAFLSMVALDISFLGADKAEDEAWQRYQQLLTSLHNELEAANELLVSPDYDWYWADPNTDAAQFSFNQLPYYLSSLNQTEWTTFFTHVENVRTQLEQVMQTVDSTSPEAGSVILPLTLVNAYLLELETLENDFDPYNPAAVTSTPDFFHLISQYALPTFSNDFANLYNEALTNLGSLSLDQFSAGEWPAITEFRRAFSEAGAVRWAISLLVMVPLNFFFWHIMLRRPRFEELDDELEAEGEGEYQPWANLQWPEADPPKFAPHEMEQTQASPGEIEAALMMMQNGNGRQGSYLPYEQGSPETMGYPIQEPIKSGRRKKPISPIQATRKQHEKDSKRPFSKKVPK